MVQGELTFRVELEEAGQRLDVYLTRCLPDCTRSQLQQWIAQGRVEVEGHLQKAGYRVRCGETIRARPPTTAPTHLVAESIPLEILYEDDTLVVINKPAGMVVHPGAGHPAGTLVNALLYHFRQLRALHPLRPGIVHRLDKQTSGLLLVAKEERTQELLARQFRKRTVDKFYLALSHGRVEPRQGSIDVPIGRHPTRRTHISTRSRRARAALTRYRVLRWFEEFSLLEVRLHTGRTHQIRVHLQHLGHPVVGDSVYGAGSARRVRNARIRERLQELDRHFLHAWKLGFQHPWRDVPLRFRAPLPRELVELLIDLK